MSKAKRRRLTDDELIWLAYCHAPAESRLCGSIEDMPDSTKAIWLHIAKRNIANGWNPTDDSNWEQFQ